MKFTSLLVFLVLPAVAGNVHAQLYKCKSANGAIEYADRPCATGTQTTVSIVENAVMDGQAVQQAEAKRRALAAQQRALDAQQDAINQHQYAQTESRRSVEESARKQYREKAQRIFVSNASEGAKTRALSKAALESGLPDAVADASRTITNKRGFGNTVTMLDACGRILESGGTCDRQLTQTSAPKAGSQLSRPAEIGMTQSPPASITRAPFSNPPLTISQAPRSREVELRPKYDYDPAKRYRGEVDKYGDVRLRNPYTGDVLRGNIDKDGYGRLRDENFNTIRVKPR